MESLQARPRSFNRIDSCQYFKSGHNDSISNLL